MSMHLVGPYMTTTVYSRKKSKVKKKYEVISVATDKNLINLRKILLKNANK